MSLHYLHGWSADGYCIRPTLPMQQLKRYSTQHNKKHKAQGYVFRMSSENEEINSSSIFDSLLSLRRNFSQASAEGFGTKARNVAKSMSVGDVVVPLCGNLTQRQILANRGIYPGVEYQVCSLRINDKEVRSMGELSNLDRVNVVAQMKPAYKLRKHLERDDWPVEINPLQDVPLWLSKTTYEAGTFVGILGLSLSYLFVAGIIAFFVRFAYVPSASMEPSLSPGDVVLVTRTVWPFQPNVGDVVLFDPPLEFNDAIIASGMTSLPTKGQQLLKRVVAKEGEYVGVKNSEPYVNLSMGKGNVQEETTKQYRVDIIGPYSQPQLFSETSWNRSPEKLGKNQYFVAGDNGFRSVDSRVWGALNGKYVLGSAKWVVWPLDHFGPMKDGQMFMIEK